MKHNGIARNLYQVQLRSTIFQTICPYISRQIRNVSSRQRRDDFWSPTVNIHKQDATPDATSLLIRAGYLRQAYAGIFHMLPLGLRVQEKLERLIDKHMKSVGASKVSFSSISSQGLWQRSGRLATGSELFKFQDRKQAKWLLAPTHEEELTTLMADCINDDRQLPVRLYQISRKYRDEKRPRGGLLRGREFIMKDLYTFDKSVKDAHVTYDEVRAAYRNLLTELGVPFIEARADSGNMGGNLSHEYHFPSESGEDNVITCTACDFARNEEFVNQTDRSQQKINLTDLGHNPSNTTETLLLHQDFVSKDHKVLVRALAAMPSASDGKSAANTDMFNPYAVKEALEGIAELDTGREDPTKTFEDSLNSKPDQATPQQHSVYYLVDHQLDLEQAYHRIVKDKNWLEQNNSDVYLIMSKPGSSNTIRLLKHQSGDSCPSCETGNLKLNTAIEVGHTFHLGTRYSSKLGLKVTSSDSKTSQDVQMGCHGIGVTRLVAAVAACLSGKDGLIWPRSIAPFDVVICTEEKNREVAHQLYDSLAGSSEEKADVLLDDRESSLSKSLGYKIKDAHMVGYPVVVILGKAVERGKVEIHCRRLDVQQDVAIEEAPAYIQNLLRRL